MNEAYARRYARLWHEHWWWQARAAWVLRWVESLAADRRDLSILDAGCGDGLFFDELGRFGEVHGLEPDERLLTNGPNRDRIDVGRLDDSFQPRQGHDLVLALDVLEHCSDEAAALEAVHRALKPDGSLLLTVPALPWLWSAHDVVNQHFRRYTRATLAAALHRAGFERDELRYFYFWTLAPLAARRWLAPPGAGAEEAATRIPPRPINTCLRWLSGVDHALAGRISLPLGTSLLAIAHRPAAPGKK